MSQAKRASKGKRPPKAVSVLGIAGMSLAASTAGSVADIPSESSAASMGRWVADARSLNAAPFQLTLEDEEISDVSLATFYLFDKEGLGAPQAPVQVARGCGCGHGCGGCRGCGGRGCGGARGCGGWHGGCRACGRGCGRGCGWGGCGGCGVGWGWGGCCLSWGGCSPLC